MKRLVGGIEAGGTKFLCAVGTGPDDLTAELKFSTTTPEETIEKIVDFFTDYQNKNEKLFAIGIGSFGPLDLNPESPQYGYITATPKNGWSNTNLAGRIENALNIPVVLDTDTNIAAFGEWKWGAAKGLDSFIYLTIGTGIGGGGMIEGKLMHGLIHPEMGHILIPHDRKADPYKGLCPFHGDCLEGLASGPAIEDRWKMPAEKLSPEHPAWKLESEYLALALVNYIVTLSPKRIIMGGGVMNQHHLFPMIRQRVKEILNGYIVSDAIQQNIDSYIVPPELGNKAGILGAIAFAQYHANLR